MPHTKVRLRYDDGIELSCTAAPDPVTQDPLLHPLALLSFYLDLCAY